MKTLFLAFVCFITCCAKCQLTIGVKGGYNNTKLNMTSNSFVNPGGVEDTYGGGSGWQAGLYAERALHKWFIYSGADVSGTSFYHNSAYGFDYRYINTTYRPVYLSVPLGAGYLYSFAKNFALKLYGGVYGQAALGGKAKTSSLFCGDLLPCQEDKSITEKHNIEFSKTTPGSLAPLNAGLQIGAGIQALKKVEVVFMYNAGLSNIMPADFKNYPVRLSTFTIDAKYKLTTFGAKHRG